MFDHIDHYPGDPILSLAQAYLLDPYPEKVNLGIGMYYDEAGRTPVLEAVQRAKAMLEATGSNKDAAGYLPMEGCPEYRHAIQCLLFGEDSGAVESGRIATIQTLGGSGALKVGADVLKQFFPSSEVWLSQPTWDNHQALFAGAGFKVNSHPYYDRSRGGIVFDEMMRVLRSLPAQSIVVMHPCCHNPTGADLTRRQWQEVIKTVSDRGLIPFLDIAYQGLGEDLEGDAHVIRSMAAAGIRFLVANSFSKNLALYGERCGGLSVVCQDAEEASRVLGQLKATVRKNYSSPPTYGARLASTVLGNAELKRLWKEELDIMRTRIQRMRGRLCHALASRLPTQDSSYLIRQRGMFSYTSLTVAQIDKLREDYSVYLVRSGRLCLTGLNDRNVDYVAEAIATVVGRT